MKKTRIVLTKDGPRQLRRSPEIEAALERHARPIAAAAGPGMKVLTSVGRNRARAVVITATREARHAEATRRALTSAIWAGR